MEGGVKEKIHGHESRMFVMGDIHGAYQAMLECFRKAAFDNQYDMLICLGDASDGWPEVNRVFDELLKIKNLVYIMGNHDEWTLKWFETGNMPYVWLTQGGDATITSYPEEIPASHVNLLRSAKEYFIHENKLFVHGGIYTDVPVEKQQRETLLWNRTLVQSAIYYASCGFLHNLSSFDEIFVGHTPTLNFNSSEPIHACEVWLMDTGAGWNGGCLSMMDIKTHRIYKSRPVQEYYPGILGRDKF